MTLDRWLGLLGVAVLAAVWLAAPAAWAAHCEPGYEHDPAALDPETEPCIASEPAPEPTPSCDPYAGLVPADDGSGCWMVVAPRERDLRTGLAVSAALIIPATAAAVATLRR